MNPEKQYCVPVIATLLDLCASTDDLDTILAGTDDLSILELALQIKIHRSHKGKTKLHLVNTLKNLLGMITPANCDRICGVLGVILHGDPSDTNFRCLIEHLYVNSDDIRETVRLLEVAVNIYEPYLFYKIITEVYLKAKAEDLKFLRQNVLVKYVKFGGCCTNLIGAVLNRRDLQTLLCLSDGLTALAWSQEFWDFLQSNLLSDVYGDRKLALHIMKGCIGSLKMLGSYPDILQVNEKKSTSDFTQVWNEFFNLMEVLEDNQLHLITPSLILLDNIVGINPMWLVCVYKSMITHASNLIAFHGVSRLLDDVYGREAPFFQDVIKYLLLALNTMDNSEGLHKSLASLKNFIAYCSDENYVILLRESLGVPWIPTAAWYFYKTVLNKRLPLPLFTELIRKFEGLPHKFIREGCLSLIATLLGNADISLEDFLKCADYLLEYNLKLTPKWNASNADIHNILEKWQRHEGFVTSGKMHVLLGLIQERDDALLHRLFQLSKDETTPAKTRDYIMLHLSESHFNKADIYDYFDHRLNHVDASDDFRLLIKIITRNFVPSNLIGGKLLEKAARIAKHPKTFGPHQVQLALAIMCCGANHLKNLRENLERALLGDLRVKMQACVWDFFIFTYSTLVIDKGNVLHVFECLLNTEDAVTNVFRHLPNIMECFTSDDNALKFLKLCFEKLRGLMNSTAASCLKQYLACRFDSNEVNCLGFEASASVYALAEVFAVKARQGMDLNCFIPTLVELLLYGEAYNKQRKVEYDVCLEIESLSGKHLNENPAFWETKIRSAAIATLLNVLDKAVDDVARRKTADSIASSLLNKYEHYFNKRYFADSQIHLQKLRIAQALLVVHTCVSPELKIVLVEFVMNSFCNESHQPSVKHLFQWLLILLSLPQHCDDFIVGIADKIKLADHTRPSTIAAFIPVLLHVCKGKSEKTIENLFGFLIPWTMGPQFKLRLYAQIAIKKLADLCRVATYRSVLSKYESMVDAVQSVLTPKDTLQNDCYFLEAFDPEGHYTLETIYAEIPRLTGVAPTEWELLDLKGLPEGGRLKVHNVDGTLKKCIFEVREAQRVDDGGGACFNIQKKITPRINQEAKGELILVCSLVESAANLGGLSRTCEVYGVRQMVVADVKIANSKDFKSLSMSSENWVDITGVKVEALGDFLMGAKRRGYVVIGAEQTCESVRLDEFKFPTKSLLILGNEKEGISPSIIPLLDVCLEIPQFGVIRSLNVHVAGAVFIWEYVKQHLVK